MKITKLKFLSLITGFSVASLSGINSNAQQTHTESWYKGIERSLVYCPGDFNSKYYRIPAIVTAKDGSIVTVADKRINSMKDLPGKIDVVSRRSTDGGRTWSPYVTVAANDSIGGCGDPALVVDNNTGDILTIYNHGNGLWSKTPPQICISRSKDNGQTWSDAININPQIFATGSKDSELIKCASAFATSGRATQLDNGRIIFALVVREKGNDYFPVYAVYSDDGGYNWKVSQAPATDNGDESKIVQLADGSLIMSIRNRFGTLRKFSYSYDNGETWSGPVPIEDLTDPRCNGDIIRYTTPEGKDYLLQSLPGSPTSRDDVTIFVSEDNGKTWPIRKDVVTSPSAYSSMTILPDNSIGILTEESQNDHRSYDIWFTRIPFEVILAGDKD